MTHEHKSLAGALILACATQDTQGLRAALEGVREYGKPVDVMLSLADTAAYLMVQLHGDGWREALQAALVEATLGADSDDNAT